MGWAITCHQSLPLVDSAKSWSCGLLKGLIKQPKNRILPIFSPNFTLNGQIWLFYAEKWIFFKKKKPLVLCLTHSLRKFHRKTRFEASLAVFWSLSCEALKLTTKPFTGRALRSLRGRKNPPPLFPFLPIPYPLPPTPFDACYAGYALRDLMFH